MGVLVPQEHRAYDVSTGNAVETSYTRSASHKPRRTSLTLSNAWSLRRSRSKSALEMVTVPSAFSLPSTTRLPRSAPSTPDASLHNPCYGHSGVCSFP